MIRRKTIVILIGTNLAVQSAAGISMGGRGSCCHCNWPRSLPLAHTITSYDMKQKSGEWPVSKRLASSTAGPHSTASVDDQCHQSFRPRRRHLVAGPIGPTKAHWDMNKASNGKRLKYNTEMRLMAAAGGRCTQKQLMIRIALSAPI
jgi:hypothetical protein